MEDKTYNFEIYINIHSLYSTPKMCHRNRATRTLIFIGTSNLTLKTDSIPVLIIFRSGLVSLLNIIFKEMNNGIHMCFLCFITDEKVYVVNLELLTKNQISKVIRGIAYINKEIV